MNFRKLANSELIRKSTEEFKRAEKTPVILILDNVRSAHNIGSVFRTADAFLIKKIFLCGVCATPPDKNIRKTALGATQTVDWEYAKSTLEVVQNLQKQNIRVVAVEQTENSVSLTDFAPPTNRILALVFGNEIKGVQQEVVSSSDHVIEIPQLGSKHSFNLSVSVGIVCWDLLSKLKVLEQKR